MSTEINSDNAEFDKLLEEAINSPAPVKWTETKVIKVRDAVKRTRQVAFLKAFAGCGTITGACKAIGINAVTEHNWRKSDPWYMAHFKDALQGYKDLIETEVHNRAITGEQVPIIGKVAGPFGLEDKIIGYKTVKSDLLLMFHGKRHVMEYRDKYEPPKEDTKPVETGSPMARITIRLDMMSKRQQVEIPAGARELNAIGITPEVQQIPESVSNAEEWK